MANLSISNVKILSILWAKISLFLFFALIPQNLLADDEYISTSDSDNGKESITVEWKEIEHGIDFGESKIRISEDGSYGILEIIRIDPKLYSFRVYSSSEPGERGARPLRAWIKECGLVVAINAGMYLPDKLTHTGYLRIGNFVNNGHIASNLGVFFASMPDSKELPDTVFIEKSNPEWRELITHYESVIQNYRLLSHDRRVQWTNDGPAHAISAVGQDGKGRILFLHISDSITCANFAKMLLEIPIDIRSTMYVEGGPQAGLFLNAGGKSHIWTGKYPTGIWSFDIGSVPLPNIIGVTRR